MHVHLRQPINSACGERVRRHSDFQAVLVMRRGTERQSLGEALVHFKGDGGDVLLLVSLPPGCDPALSMPPLIVTHQGPACYPLTAYICATAVMFEKFREI